MKSRTKISLALPALLASSAIAGEWVTDGATPRGHLTIHWSSAHTDDKTASHVVQACFRDYARIVDLLGASESNAGRHIGISFATNLPPNVPASTGDGRIQISAAHAARYPADLTGLVIHELSHLIQAYPSPNPGWVTEGIADAVRLALSPVVDPWRRRVESAPRLSTDYRHGYGEAARFLLWIRDQGNPELLRQLNAAMVASRLKDDFWALNTGKSIDEWWSLYTHEQVDAP